MTRSEQDFYARCDEAIDRVLKEAPVSATALGDHRYDHLLDDMSPESLDKRREEIGRWLEELESLDPQDWSVDARIDLILMVNLLRSFVRDHDRIRGVHKNPSSALRVCMTGVYLLIARDFAPLPVRLESVLSRLREVPRLLNQGRALIVPEEVPPVWVQTAVESGRQGAGLFTGLIPLLAKAAPSIASDLVQAGQSAGAAVMEYVEWLSKEVVPVAKGDFAVGREIFDEILRDDHMVDYDSRELMEIGHRLLAETREEIKAVASGIDPGASVEELIERAKADHPTPEGLIDAYTKAMAEARQFVIDHEIATIPDNEKLRMEPTPAFMRPVIPYAAYMPPGPLEAAQEGIFIITPVDGLTDPSEISSKLRGHPMASIPTIAVHEAYPGHHLQLTVSNRSGRMPRPLASRLSSLFIEGWAFYCEELMETLGFSSSPMQRLMRLKGQLWRAARIVVDVGLHTGEMGVAEAEAFLVENAALEPKDAMAEVRRYTSAPTQPQSYLMGKIEIVKVIDDYKRLRPYAAMKDIHDTILAVGSLPPKLMRMKLMGE